jgi:hypothetical protein
MLIDDRPEEDDEEAMDKYLNVELVMNAGTNDEQFGHVLKRAWELNGEPIGHAHANPLFDTHEYEIEFTSAFAFDSSFACEDDYKKKGNKSPMKSPVKKKI